MKVIDATALNNSLLNNTYNQPGFAPGIGYTYNSAAKTVTLTEKGTVPAGDTFKRANIEIHDGFGKSVQTSIGVAAANTGAVSVATLNPSQGLRVTATVVTDKGCISDGSTELNAAAGDLQNWDKDYSGAEALA